MLRVRRGVLDGVSNATADGADPLPEHGEPFYAITVNLRKHRRRCDGFQQLALRFVHHEPDQLRLVF